MKLVLNLKIPMLDIGRAQVALKSERRRWRTKGKGSRESVAQSQWQIRQRKVKVEIKVRRIEVKAFSRSEGGLVKINPVSAVKHGAFAAPRRPGDSQAGSPVVPVGIVSAARQAFRSDRYQRPAPRVKKVCAVESIHRGRVVLVSDSQQQIQIAPDVVVILE